MCGFKIGKFPAMFAVRIIKVSCMDTLPDVEFLFSLASSFESLGSIILSVSLEDELSPQSRLFAFFFFSFFVFLLPSTEQ